MALPGQLNLPLRHRADGSLHSTIYPNTLVLDPRHTPMSRVLDVPINSDLISLLISYFGRRGGAGQRTRAIQ